MEKVDRITNDVKKHKFQKPNEDFSEHLKEESHLSYSPNFHQKHEKVKSKKKKKKHEKKKKKHKKKKNYDKDKDNSSSDEEEEWIEAVPLLTSSEKNKDEEQVEAAPSPTSSDSKREDWMNFNFDFIPSVSKKEIKVREQNVKEKTEGDKNSLSSLYKPGHHHRELNPYWKNGGTGLPPDIKKETSFSSLVEEGLKNQDDFQKDKQQAKVENRNLRIADEGYEVLENSKSLSDTYKKGIKDECRYIKSNRHRGKYHGKDHDRITNEFVHAVTKDHSSSSKFQKPSERNNPHLPYSSQIHKSKSRPSWMKEAYVKHDSQPTHDAKSSDSEETQQSSEAAQQQKTTAAPQGEMTLLSDKEMNVLGAKIVKAELLGNFEIAAMLKTKLDAARQAKKAAEQHAKDQKGQNEEIVILTQTDTKGLCRPLPEPASEILGSRKKKQKVGTHDTSGKRVSYFPDDGKYSLKQMFEKEKFTSAEDQNSMFLDLAGKSTLHTNDDYDIDDIFLDKAAKKGSNYKTDEQERSRAIYEYKQLKSAMDKCPYCFDSSHLKKHLIIAVGLKAFLCLPGHQSLIQGHCLIIPMRHLSATTLLDEDEWEEVQNFRKNLTRMFNDKGDDVIFMEISKNLRWHPHTFIECIPVPKEIGDMAPIYFKKAILESDVEWAINKKLIDLSVKNIQHSVPKGLPYFSVDFGLQGGFAHVIEDEKLFPSYFGKEIIGGMMDLEPNLWRKPRFQKFEDQSKKILEFSELWKPFGLKL